MINPLLLWFLPLAMVPILLHLITLYRLRTVELSTFRFLMESYVQQRRRVKLLEYLLMILRVLFIMLIILTMARPVIDRFAGLFGSQSGRDVVFVVDAGVTMGLNAGGTTSLGRAQSATRTVMGLLGPTDHVTIIRAAHKPQVVASGFASNAEPMIQQLEQITADLTAADLPAALGEALGAAQHGPRIVYVLTDAQRRAWSALAEHPVVKKLDAKAQLVVMDVGSNEPVKNTAVVGDPPRALRPVVGLPTLLTATVAASPEAEAIDTKLSVMIDDQMVTQVPITLAPGERVTRSITIVPEHAGILRGRFELPADDFPDDDQYLFCLNVEPHVNVMVVVGDANLKGAENPGLFVKAALQAPLLARGVVSREEQRIAESLSITMLDERQINDNNLAVADVVILADVAMDERRGALLRQYVENGGGVMVLAGPRCDADSYKRNLLSGRVVAASEPPPLWYEPPTGDVNDESTFQPITSIDLRHPVLSAFDDDDDKTEFFGTARLYRYMPISLGGSGASQITPMMRLPDRRAALAQMRLGNGRIMLAAFAATPDWSNLPLKPEFVPLMLRAVAYMRRDEPVQAVQVVRPYEPAPIQLADPWTEANVQAIDPAGRPRKIELHRSDRVMVGAMLGADRRGYYTFVVQPPAEGRNVSAAMKPQQRGFAVNLDVDDAGFETMPESQMRQLFKPHEITVLRGSPDDPVLAEQLTQRHEIWRTLIWLMFIVMGAEFLLSTLRPVGSRDRRKGITGGVRNLAERLGARANAPPAGRVRRDLSSGQSTRPMERTP